MDGFQVICTIFVTVVTYADMSGADHEYMTKEAESVTVPIGFVTTLQCAMNIEPDKFQWKFYPLPKKDAFNPKASISLTTSNFELVPTHNRKYMVTTQKKKSDLAVQADNEEIAGDYQCLAHYGASVVASVPWRITISTLGQFPEQENIEVTVVAGNTINWRCDPPTKANPEAYIDYYRNDQYIDSPLAIARNSLIIPNVNTSHSGKYSCKAFNSEDTVIAPTYFNLKVVQTGPSQAPWFIMPPKSQYTVVRGESVFLECVAVGNPVPEVVWKKRYGTIPEKRGEMVKGGLIIRNVTSSDGGVYECNQKNSRGTISHQITLLYNEPPRIDCLINSTDVKQGQELDLDRSCTVTGVPEPEISWFLNGFSVKNDSEIEAIGNKIYFRNVEKRHAGNLQIFARNVVKTVYSSISIKVIPLTMTLESSSDSPVPPTRTHRGNNPRKHQKHTKMIPPSKPTVSRLNDEAVAVRWTVQPNKGLPIQFFKVQYRELGPANQHEPPRKGSKWMTTNADIPPHIRSYEVNGLKSDHWYRFRIAAVYSNNDNKNSPNSEKFHLKKLDFDKRNPLPVPLITKTEPINSTSVKIYWKVRFCGRMTVLTCAPTPNITVEGFFVNYNSASSAGDYLRASVNGPNASSYVLTHLQPDTVYDIKLQSFNANSASEYSSIMKAKTLGAASSTLPTTKEPVTPEAVPEAAGVSKLYIIIAAGVLGSCGVIFAAVALLIFYRKWKQKKNNSRGDRDKSGVDERHIQADGNEYVVGPKTAPRSNGVAPNRITITANPLADADNKNQNMIEMSCLSSQNNNCSAVQPSGSGEDSPTNSRDRKNKHREKRIRNKKVESNTSGENYV